MAPNSFRRPPYKDFLQPALHRRFSTTALLVLAIAYIQAIWLGRWDSWLWSLLPFGYLGVRTIAFFICGVLVVVLRIALLHVGLRTSKSPIHTLVNHAYKLETVEAIFIYVSTSCLFSQVYLASLPDSAGLSWVIYFTPDRARLNERAVLFTVYFIVLGFLGAISHLYWDDDRLSLGAIKPKDRQANSQQIGDGANQWKKLWDSVPYIGLWTANQSVAALFFNIVIYAVLRRRIWHVFMLVFRLFYNLPRSNMAPQTFPFSFSSLARCWQASLMLLSLWIAGKRAFSIFLAREPLKGGKPLTADSRDPNGSLLNGLKSKKLLIQCFAMWELAFIARDYQERRKTIYEDIERRDGSAWSQICTVCLEVIQSLQARADAFGPSAAAAPSANTGLVKDKKTITHSLKDEATIFNPVLDDKTLRKEVDKALFKATNSPKTASLRPLVNGVAVMTKDVAVKVQRKTFVSQDQDEDWERKRKGMLVRLLGSPVGLPFQHQYKRRITSATLGRPHGEPSLYINAVSVLSLLAAHSLREDKYGNVQRDIARVIRALTAVIRRLESFMKDFPTHWTDVSYSENRECPEVDSILEALKEGLDVIVSTFGSFSQDLNLTAEDMRLARESAGVPRVEEATAACQGKQEMRQLF